MFRPCRLWTQSDSALHERATRVRKARITGHVCVLNPGLFVLLFLWSASLLAQEAHAADASNHDTRAASSVPDQVSVPGQTPIVHSSNSSSSIVSAFGLEFGVSTQLQRTGATIDGSPLPVALYNLVSDEMASNPVIPRDTLLKHFNWQHFYPQSLPPRLENRGIRFFSLHTDDHQLAIVTAILPSPCGDLSGFFSSALPHKYGVTTESVPLDSPGLRMFTEVHRWSSEGRHIVLACGSISYLAYGDAGNISKWKADIAAKSKTMLDRREQQLIAQSSMLVPGQSNALRGAFGILFNVPLKGHEQLPKQEVTSYPNLRLPAPYDKATYEVMLDAAGCPIRISASFEGIDFSMIRQLMQTRFGAPETAGADDVQHLIDGNELSLHRLDNGTRVTVVDTAAASSTPFMDTASVGDPK